MDSGPRFGAAEKRTTRTRKASKCALTWMRSKPPGYSGNRSAHRYARARARTDSRPSAHSTSNALINAKRAQPDVWIFAHQMLWHPQAAFDLCAVVIDEGFWRSAIREPITITLDELRRDPDLTNNISVSACADLGPVMA